MRRNLRLLNSLFSYSHSLLEGSVSIWALPASLMFRSKLSHPGRIYPAWDNQSSSSNTQERALCKHQEVSARVISNPKICAIPCFRRGKGDRTGYRRGYINLRWKTRCLKKISLRQQGKPLVSIAKSKPSATRRTAFSIGSFIEEANLT